ncbi:serine/arginine-rich splicing factor 4/5/6 [Nematocida minor]|uniref:serine/arginine-rich splicing factor 4/5/6 n=1 Tax=Nematocida minor TaxID=1912983 RepID=UPI0022207DCD|nr:serine/arginine-rich splicing factor 4/5/6 [Nematocida minor]KAI5189223.1 serine/arginine-rich splicing factor 4/5/6 [Nematocida minor]
MEMQLYIGGLKEFSQEKEIEEYFSRYGKILSIKIYSSYGFVTVDEEAGKKILNDTHEINGNRLIIEAAKGERPVKPAYTRGPVFGHRPKVPRRISRLILENLPQNSDWSELRSFILMSGARPTYLRILPSGDGLLEFMNRHDRDTALERLNNQGFHGKNITARFGRKRSDIVAGHSNTTSPEK